MVGNRVEAVGNNPGQYQVEVTTNQGGQVDV